MIKNELIFPMALYVLFMWISTVYMFRTRVKSVKSGEIPLSFFRAHVGNPGPERVIAVGRHYDNQFQVPLLFFITCALHMQVARANWLTLTLAWLFVASRGVHSWILLGRNNVRKRVAVFAFGWLVILALWIQLVYFSIG